MTLLFFSHGFWQCMLTCQVDVDSIVCPLHTTSKPNLLLYIIKNLETHFGTKDNAKTLTLQT